MRRRTSVLFIFLFSLFQVSALADSSDPYKEAQTLHKMGNFKEMKKLLKSINKDHPQYKYILAALIKTSFKNKEYDEFFGYMYFYKVNNLMRHNISADSFDQSLLALEALALNKLCRWKDALKIVLKTKNLAEKLKVPPTREILQTEIFIVSSLRVNGFEREYKKTLKDHTLMTKDGFWSLNNTQINKLDNPKNLRMNVRSMCKS